ncbi:glycosyltransferase [Marinifilum caeruleilacunae]|uniref:glycosyltransferase n=1 Tax=Marinifilum caeruleilacunae TaxID=2499076 RepID=UPI001491AF4E|nr:glycosyltransferase [Marinifilum caeruleilacunae]
METYFYHSLTPFQWFLIIGLALSFLTELFYSNFYLRKIKKKQEARINSASTPVSIVICAKNQAHYLEKNLRGFLNQDYPNFEIIVVDNGSVDDTEDVLIRLKNEYPHLRSTKIPIDDKFKHNKKLAITIGVKAAKHDRILHLNPNSFANSETWLQNTMAQAEGKLYNAYSNFDYRKGFFYNFYRYDLSKQMIKLAAFTKSNKLYAGNAYNMSFSKTDFLNNKGYAGNAHFEAGYDHILSIDLAKKTDYTFSSMPDTKLSVDAKNQAKVWRTLKKYYFRSRKHIPFKRKFLLDLEPVAQFLFLLFLILSAIYTQLYFSLLALYLVKIAVKGYSFKNALRHLREENLFLSSYVYVFLRPIYNLIFYIQSCTYSKRS